jgi:cellulose synthase/poly-beta-1,6-N-acetylglucosamine synthase-like glycosyltransferase
VLFTENDRKEKVRLSATNHAEVVTWEGYQINPKPWIMNGNTLAFRKEAVLEVGGYDPARVLDEDRDLELRLLEKWGRVYTLNEPLVLYRIHAEQATQKLRNK